MERSLPGALAGAFKRQNAWMVSLWEGLHERPDGSPWIARGHQRVCADT